MLRAYRALSDPEFDSRHDLLELLRASNLENFVPQKRRAEVAAALGEVWVRWKNDYRYAPTGRLSQALRGCPTGPVEISIDAKTTKHKPTHTQPDVAFA
jgi:hypothetical protein